MKYPPHILYFVVPLASTAVFACAETANSFVWAVLALYVLSTIRMPKVSRNSYASIPAIGRTGFISSYLDMIRIIRGSNNVLQEGYHKYRRGVFRIPLINRWLVIVCEKKLTEELRKAPDALLSIEEVTKEALSLNYTLGHKFASDMYHIGVIRSQLNRNISNVFPEICDEVVTSLEDNIPITDEWIAFNASDTMKNIIVQTTNRIFVGVSTCRDPEYIKLVVDFIDALTNALALNLLPNQLKPVACYLFTQVPASVRASLKYLGPIIEGRQKKINEHGPDYPDKPTDMLSWLMDEAQEKNHAAEDIALRILFVNFTAIYTSSTSLTLALLQLAANPEYLQPIRDEVESVIAESGWTKGAMTRMRKLDSFLKESQRLYGFTNLTLIRKAVNDFTFSDGTVIPSGGLVCTLPLAVHLDEERYTHAKKFDGFRFSDIRDGEEEEESMKSQMAAVGPDYLSFGHGKHACPGRFLAVNVLKAIIAHLVLTYDIKLADGSAHRVAPQWRVFVCRPDPKAELMFRRRRI